MENEHYIYVYLDNRKPGMWSYNGINFNHQPFYVGKGKHGRLKQHLQPKRLSDNSIKSNTINKIISETNELPIHYKIYDGLSFDEANRIEIDMIKHFGRVDLNTGILTNMTDGGEGFKNIIFTEVTRKKMSESAIGVKTYSNNGMSKVVEQYTLDGVLLNTYNSLREAAETNGFCLKNISSCCRGKSKTASGFIWKYVGKSYKPTIKAEVKDKRKKVYQYDLDGNYITYFDSVSIAEKLTGINHISSVCLGRLNFAGGYQWRFYKSDKIDPLTLDKTKNLNRYKNEKKIN